MEKPRLSVWQIWNMSFGFLGIQFGFALQNANVSRIFETLGAKIDAIPILWIAAPVTGLIIHRIGRGISVRRGQRHGVLPGIREFGRTIHRYEMETAVGRCDSQRTGRIGIQPVDGICLLHDAVHRKLPPQIVHLLPA